MLALPYTPPTGVVDTGAGYVGQGHTFVSMDGLGLGGSAVCSAAALGVPEYAPPPPSPVPGATSCSRDRPAGAAWQPVGRLL